MDINDFSGDFDTSMLDTFGLTFNEDQLLHELTEFYQSTTHSPPIIDPYIKEGKLIINITDIYGLITTRFSFKQSYECIVTVDGSSRKFTVPANSRDSFNKEFIFDIYEYYGAIKVTFTILRKGFFSTSTIGMVSVCLHGIVLSQEKSEAVRGHVDIDAWRNSGSHYPSVCSEPYYGCTEILSLVSPQGTSSGAVSLKLRARYVPLSRCISLQSLRGDRRSELHHAAVFGSPALVTELVEALGRKNLLRSALALREDEVGYNALDMALVAGNLPIVRVFLQRAGNLCFQGTGTRLAVPTANSHDAPCDRTASGCTGIPHTSIVDKSFFAKGYRPMVRQQERWKRGGGCALHAAIIGGPMCLKLLLRFLRRYSSVLVGWEGAGSLPSMVNWRKGRADGYTPLMLACALGDAACVKMLLDLKQYPNRHGGRQGDIKASRIVSVDTVSELQGETPLMLACTSGCVDVVQLLLNCSTGVEKQLPSAADGATTSNTLTNRQVAEDYFFNVSPVSLLECLPLARDCEGRQALAMAAMCGHDLVVRLLIDHGVPYTGVDMNGMTALHHAAEGGWSGVCEVVISAEQILWEKYCPPIDMEEKCIDKEGVVYVHNAQEDKKRLEYSGNKTRTDSSMWKRMHASSEKEYKTVDPMRRSGSLSHMSRRPNNLLTQDIRGRRPADVAMSAGHGDIAARLHRAVLEVYGQPHPPTYISAPPSAAGSKLPSSQISFALSGVEKTEFSMDADGKSGPRTPSLNDISDDDNEDEENTTYEFAILKSRSTLLADHTYSRSTSPKDIGEKTYDSNTPP
mmetsp:Transcript_15071/g.22671  ORF Transcript_15071/g.22671 Transcript_15071/m.22671 type:complete len:800 (+) Transcript_15071:235-2634(+)|eukprot:CAMPEP_0185036770 /NCGR_PEP_ID=MMETSP1103-20130426/30230_1 /TAXON_ID=36769 /ORGANISM="Paraphysomonas bandaiensis, Strain Caron Lab Isolate" /LENGTH=799 /DNA_ID=CAMNT_0027574443 /DNA_START=37 /DNA_END=2436 /DNA_ORIENTATION=-